MENNVSKPIPAESRDTITVLEEAIALREKKTGTAMSAMRKLVAMMKARKNKK